MKKGDKVRCVNSSPRGFSVPLTKDKLYIVTGINLDSIYVIDDNGNNGGYYIDRFELAEEYKPVVFCSIGEDI